MKQWIVEFLWMFIITSIMLFGGYQWGKYEVTKKFIAKEESIQQVIVEKKVESEATKEKIVIRYVDRIRDVEKKVPVYIDRIQKEITNEETVACVVPLSAIRLYDESNIEGGNANSTNRPNGTPTKASPGK